MSETDRAGRTALHYAAVDNDVGKVRRLLAQGYDVNAREERDFTPLHFAAQSQAPDIVQLLLNHGAEIDARNAFGASPLLVALTNYRDDPRTVRLLRDAGADVTLENHYGHSPASHAASVTNYDLVTVLEGSDADDPEDPGARG
jgi:uncharacterized protein